MLGCFSIFRFQEKLFFFSGKNNTPFFQLEKYFKVGFFRKKERKNNTPFFLFPFFFPFFFLLKIFFLDFFGMQIRKIPSSLDFGVALFMIHALFENLPSFFMMALLGYQAIMLKRRCA